MASVDTQYSATLPASVPDQSAAGGTGAQVARTGNDKAEDIDWFSPAQSAEYHPITIRANTVITAATTLDALANGILSHIGEYMPD